MPEASILIQLFMEKFRDHGGAYQRQFVGHSYQQGWMPILTRQRESIHVNGYQFEYPLQFRVKAMHIESHAIKIIVIG